MTLLKVSTLVKKAISISPFLIKIQSTGLKTLKEDLQFVCIPKEKIKSIKHLVDFPEIAQSDSAAETAIDFNKLEEKCPANKNYRLGIHSHTHTTSLLTLQDIATAQELSSFNINGLCAAGLNGFECVILSKNKNPIYIKESWTLKQKNSLVKSLPSITADSVLCIKNKEDTYDCFGQYFGSPIEQDLGKYHAVSFLNKNVEIEQNPIFSYVLASPSEKTSLTCVTLEIPLIHKKGVGQKLICYE